MSHKTDFNNQTVRTIHPKQGIWRTYDLVDGLPGGVIRLFQDRHGYLWLAIGTSVPPSGGVCRYDGVKYTTYTTADGLAGDNVRAICEDHQGCLWFGTTEGVSCFDGEHFVNYTTADGLAGDSVQAICEDHQGRLWFGTGDDIGGGQGVSCFDGRRFTRYTTEDGLARNNSIAICEDHQKRLWFAHGYMANGITCFDGSGFTIYVSAHGLLSNRVWDMLQDREGHLWFAHYFSGGLTRFDAETSCILTDTSVDEILIEDHQKGLWYGNNNQLCSLFKGQERHKVFSSMIYSLLEDSRGCFWVGTVRDGLYCYDSVNAVWDETENPPPRHFTAEDGLGRNSIQSLLEASDGTVWVGTGSHPSGGYLCRVADSETSGNERKSFEAMPTPHPAVSRLFEDNRGRIWLGSHRGGGVSCYEDGNQLVTYTMEHGLPSNQVQSIVEDDTGNLWIGTQKGLCCFDGESFITYGKEEGLTSLLHQWSAKDVRDHLWFGTLIGGIYRTDGKHFQWLTTDDGLPSNSITGLVPQSDGSMIIGTYRGIVHYRPTATIPPRIEIREVVADQIYPNPKKLELTTTEADLVTITYHSSSLATFRMRYSYILEGYDDTWRDTWDSQVRYEKLHLGEYLFKVIAINRDLVPSDEPATLKLTIIPDPRDQQIAQLESELQRRNRELEAELQDAHNVQMSLMPQTAPAIEGVEIAGKCLPANTVSGDFFDYVEGKRSNEIALVVGDVCGKAMKGAMNAVMTDGILRATAKEQGQFTPASLMMTLNDVLNSRLERYMNVTMVIGMIDAKTKTFTLANAAHHAYPLLLRNGEIQTLKTGGLPLGMKAGIEYTEEQFKLESIDVLVLMTDGIIEAIDREGELYSDSGRLEKTISQFTPEMSAEAMVEAVITDTIDFVGDKVRRDANPNGGLRQKTAERSEHALRLSDDMTVVVAKIR